MPVKQQTIPFSEVRVGEDFMEFLGEPASYKKVSPTEAQRLYSGYQTRPFDLHRRVVVLR